MTAREKTGLHEAGHCVTAHLLGLRYGATLYQDGGGCAGTGDQSTPPNYDEHTDENFAKCYTRQPLQELMDDAIVTAGGTVAVALGSYDPLVFPAGSDRMMLSASARAAFTNCHPEVERCFVALAIAQARALLADHWQAVEMVSSELNLRGSLTADDVEALVAGATP
jgi:hypothetical protein